MKDLKDIRWRQRFQNFENAYKLLEKYADLIEYSELERAGLIQIFETAFELSWKTLKDYLEAEGYDVISPKAAIKKGFQIGILVDGALWIEALDSRNLTVHTYDEAKAMIMVEKIKEEYTPLIGQLYRILKVKMKSNQGEA